MKALTDGKAPPLRVGTTAYRAAVPGETLTHEFHLRLPARPVHVALIGAALDAVRVEDEVDSGRWDLPSTRGELRETPAFRESSIETTPDGVIRVDYDLDSPEGLRENLVVFVDFECTLKAKGQVTILLIFESPGQPTKV